MKVWDIVSNDLFLLNISIGYN